MSDTQMLSKYLPKKLYNAAADEDGTALTALSGLADKRLDVLEDWVGDYAAPAKGSESDIATDLKKVYADVETDETGLLARAAALEAVAPTTGAPITTQVRATAISSDGNNDEITWTAVANGEDGNGITIVITLSAEASVLNGAGYNGIDIIVDGNAIVVDVKTGQGTTATDVLTAVNAHETAGLLVRGALTGSGGAITADSVVTDGGVDITAGLAGAIRYEANKIWISVGESTASVSNWKYATLL